MSDFNNCPDCGGSDGNHYGDCIYDGTNYVPGNSSWGFNSALAGIVFGLFFFFGVCVGALCPPIGALIILAGASLTGA